MKTSKAERPFELLLVGQSPAARLWRSVAISIPTTVRKWLRGPVARIEVGAGLDNRAPKGSRPVDLVVPPALMLRHRLSIPAEARGDLRHAAELFIRHDTPFDPSEVVTHLEELADRDEGTLRFEMRIVPRDVLRQVMQSVGLKPSRIGRIVLSGTTLPDAWADIGGLVLKRSKLRGWVVLVPVVVAVVSLSFAAAQQLGLKRQAIDLLEAQISQTLLRVKALDAELEKRGKTSAGIEQIRSLLAHSPSRFETLERLRQVLPDGAEVLEIHARDLETRIALRAVNAISVAQILGAPGTAWAGSVEGAIVTDPSGHQEMATVVLSPKDAQ